MKKKFAFIFITVLLNAILISKSFAQQITLSFHCLDSSNSLINIQLPEIISTYIDGLDSIKSYEVTKEYLFSHDSCLVLFNKKSKWPPVLFISTENLDLIKSASPIEAAVNLLKQYESESKLLEDVSLKKHFLYNYTSEIALIIFRDIKTRTRSVIAILFVNNRLVTIALSIEDEKSTDTLHKIISGIKLSD